MEVALVELGRCTSRPDRLSDAAQRRGRAGMTGDEPLPGGNDPRRILADHAHVGEEHAIGVAVERRPQIVDLGAADHHECRLVGLESIQQERGRAVEELVGTCIEERLVPERLIRAGRIKLHRAHDRRLPRRSRG